jgi:hypothetical protein
MRDVPWMDGADVSPTMDGDRQVLPWSRRDSAEEIWLRAKNIFTPPGNAGALIGQQVQISEIPVCDWPNATLRARAHARRAREPAGASSPNRVMLVTAIWKMTTRFFSDLSQL